MKSKDYIIKDPQWQATQDYQRLRKEGLQHIEKLGHKLWTDFNVHDPGITQLELLCYAITDLGHRTNYDIKDILTTEDNGTPAIRDEFHTAKDIFSCNPVSFNDLRKRLIDIKGISNAWIEKHRSIQFCVDTANETLIDCAGSDTDGDRLPSFGSPKRSTMNGLFDVYIDYDKPDLNSTDKQLIIEEVKERLFTHRNLCEDIVNICDLDKEDIALCTDIEVKPSADIEDIMLKIFFQLDQFISPDVKFYTIAELLDKGKSTDEIFAGPALDHGFIDDDEFRQLERHCVLRVSDIIQIIMNIPDVVSIKDISLLSFIDGVKRDQQKWMLNLATDSIRSPTFSPAHSRITFYKNGLPYFARSKDIDLSSNNDSDTQQKHILKDHERDLPIPIGEYKALEDYYPVQNDMPANYKVGRIKVPESASAERKAQSRQLKAWLLFFEQMLANYLSQLANMHELFSWKNGTGKTYFTQQLTGIHEIENLYIDHGKLDTELHDIIESNDVAEQRKNRFLDHLLARFCESFTDYSALMHNLDGEFTQQRLIEDKREFLENYPQLSQQRGQGFDYRDPKNTDNLSGYQKRTYRLLGIEELTRRDFSCQGFSIEKVVVEGEKQWQFLLKNDQKELLFQSIPCESRDSIEALLDLSLHLGCCYGNYQPGDDDISYELVQSCEGESTKHIIGHTASEDLLIETLGYFQKYTNAEGFHVIEHSLLRPRGINDPSMPIQINKAGDCVDVYDPYSFHISIILPSWPRRFQDLRFRKFVEDTLRLEAPAHIQTRICWLSHTQMQQLEQSYNHWAEQLAEQIPNIGACHGEYTQDFSGQSPLPEKSPDGYTESLNHLIKTLHSLTTVYPLAKLHDCEHIDTDAPPITLNNTILGTF